MGLLSFLLFIIGFISFIQGKKYISLLAIVTLSTSWFGFAAQNIVLGAAQIQHGDLALMLIFSLLPFRKKGFPTELKELRNALVLFVLFLTVSIIYDHLINGTTFMQIFRTTRKTGYLAFLFLINSFSARDYIVLFKGLVAITAIHAILYISQYLFGFNFSSNEIELNEVGEARYRNLPSYLIPVFVYVLFQLKNIRFQWGLLLVLFITILLSQSRGAIISAFVAIMVFLFLNKKVKIHVVIVLSLLSIIGYNLIINYFPIISDRFIDAYSQYNTISEMDFNNLEDFFYNGSMIFRIGIIYERLTYVLESFSNTIFGVGFVPDIDLTTRIFTLGTASPSLYVGYEQYNTVDIFLPNIITRYGIVGSCVFLFFIWKLFVFSFKNRSFLFGKILFVYLIAMLLISMVNETFYNGQYFLVIFFLIGLILLEKKTVSENQLI